MKIEDAVERFIPKVRKGKPMPLLEWGSTVRKRDRSMDKIRESKLYQDCYKRARKKDSKVVRKAQRREEVSKNKNPKAFYEYT